MSEFTDDDFDSFLTSSWEQDSRQTELEAEVLAIRTVLSDALRSANNTPIEDPVRRASLEDDVEHCMRVVDPYVSGEEVHRMAQRVETEIGLKEGDSITRILMVLAFNKMTSKEGNRSIRLRQSGNYMRSY